VEKEADSYLLTTLDDKGTIRTRKLDRIIQAIGYDAQIEGEMLKNVTVPVYKIGWARTGGKGNLSDALSSSVALSNRLIEQAAAAPFEAAKTA